MIVLKSPRLALALCIGLIGGASTENGSRVTAIGQEPAERSSTSGGAEFSAFGGAAQVTDGPDSASEPHDQRPHTKHSVTVIRDISYRKLRNNTVKDAAKDVDFVQTEKEAAKAQPASSNDSLGNCDLFLPAKTDAATPIPVIVIVHGGGWATGDKWIFENYGRSLARQGMAAVSINYRLAPADKFPAQVDDVRRALLWVKQNRQKYKFDLQRLGLFGYSAGGHLSLLIAALADEDVATQASASNWNRSDTRWKKLPKIAAVCAGGPPCDFQTLPIDNTMLGYFLGGSRREKPDVYRAASPLAHVSKDDPITTIIHGDGDMIVPIAGAKAFQQAQLAVGVESRLIVLPKQGHFYTLASDKTRQHVVEFFTEIFSDNESK